MDRKLIAKQIVRHLEEIFSLGAVTAQHFESSPRRYAQYYPDISVQITVGSERWQIFLEIISNPKQTERTVSILRSFITGKKRTYGMIGLPTPSPQAKSICREQGVGYIDTAGNCYMSFANVLVDREGKKGGISVAKSRLKSFFSLKSSRIIRILLEQPQREWEVKELIRKSKVSTGQVYNVVQRLISDGYVEKETGLLHLLKPAELLNSWQKSYDFYSNEIHGLNTREPVQKVEEKFISSCQSENIPYALTLFSAVTSFSGIEQQKFTSYFAGDTDRLKKELHLSPALQEPDILILVPYDRGVLYRPEEEMGDSVGLVQLFLDCMGFGEERLALIAREKIYYQKGY